MENYHGIIVNVSQKDKSIFDRLKILGEKKLWSWILYKVEIKPKELKKRIKELQENMTEGFYFHFYRNNELIVVFNKKVFYAKTDKSTWNEIIEYGKSLKIPEKQLDFFPCKEEDEKY